MLSCKQELLLLITPIMYQIDSTFAKIDLETDKNKASDRSGEMRKVPHWGFKGPPGQITTPITKLVSEMSKSD